MRCTFDPRKAEISIGEARRTPLLPITSPFFILIRFRRGLDVENMTNENRETGERDKGTKPCAKCRAWATYQAATAPAWTAYKRAIVLAWKAYLKATENKKHTCGRED